MAARPELTESHSGTSTASGASRKLTVAARVLAVLGGLFLLIQLWGYVSWMLSPDFVAHPVGPDPIPQSLLEGIQSAEQKQITMASLWMLWLIYGMLKCRGLTWSAITTFAWASIYWQDPLVNLVQHNFTYNLYFFNRGDWTSHLPFMLDMGSVLVQPVLLEGLAFCSMMPFLGMLTAFLLRCSNKYLAIRSGAMLIAIGWSFMFVVDYFFERSGIQQQIFSWNYVAVGFALNPGTPLQWPIVEGVLVSLMWAMAGFLSYFRGQNRFSILDVGIETIRTAPLRGAMHLLAMSGLFNLLFLLYNAGLILFAGSATASFPSWLSP